MTLAGPGQKAANSSTDRSAPIGVLLLQVGTPDSTSVSDVRRYLREFLSDPRVIDLPAPARSLLLNAVILPFRPRRSAAQYDKIWTQEGSPLRIHTDDLAQGLQTELGDGYKVVVGMRYQNPPIADAIDTLTASGCEKIVLVPLFPQYSSAASGSAAAKALSVVAGMWNVRSVSTVSPFYDNPAFIAATAEIARPKLEEFSPEHILFSYHGLPEKQIRKSDPTGKRCLARDDCCDTITIENQFCYRAQSYATTRSLARSLDLEEGSYTTVFQSRLAGQKWIEPYTDRSLQGLRDEGISRIAVLTPSFVADCLETLEEIGVRLREQWESLGDGDLLLIPCVNSNHTWTAGLADLVRESA